MTECINHEQVQSNTRVEPSHNWTQAPVAVISTMESIPATTDTMNELVTDETGFCV